ncbi:hypothetical protein, partial [Vogesella fluminis]|uniref:hypothetical protein n=1 Tax=Vogesella fluminis TaxID=1069161 RepID=UPI001E4F1725
VRRWPPTICLHLHHFRGLYPRRVTSCEPHQGNQCRRDGTETSMLPAKRPQFNDPPCFARFHRRQPRAKPHGAIIANWPTAMQKSIKPLKSIACHLKHAKSAYFLKTGLTWPKPDVKVHANS